MAKQTKITIRRDGLLILRGRSCRRAWCPGCRAEGEMIAVDRSTVICGLNGLDLHRVEGGHWVHADNPAVVTALLADALP